MNKTLKIIISAVVALVIVVLCVSLVNKNTKTVVVGGAPDLSNSPYLIVNGVTKWFTNVPMVYDASKKAVCSIQNPVPSTASSTLEYVSLRFNSVSTSTTYTLATSTSATATSSATTLSTGTAATGATDGWIPTTWASGALATSTYVDVILAATSTLNGTCQAVFLQY
jgi:hypothetical protein